MEEKSAHSSSNIEVKCVHSSPKIENMRQIEINWYPEKLQTDAPEKYIAKNEQFLNLLQLIKFLLFQTRNLKVSYYFMHGKIVKFFLLYNLFFLIFLNFLRRI